MKCIAFPFSLLLIVLFVPGAGRCQLKHSMQTLYPSYKGLIRAGYQGWFRAAGDGSGALYLWLTGEAAKRLRKEKPLEPKMPVRN